MGHKTKREFGHIVEGCFVNGNNRSRFLEGNHPPYLYLWHKADTDSGVLGNMLQILGVAVAIDCNNIRTDCAKVNCKRKSSEKIEDEIKVEKEQSQFHLSVRSALVDLSLNVLSVQPWLCMLQATKN
jgi:hypothetical protein